MKDGNQLGARKAIVNCVGKKLSSFQLRSFICRELQITTGMNATEKEKDRARFKMEPKYLS